MNRYFFKYIIIISIVFCSPIVAQSQNNVIIHTKQGYDMTLNASEISSIDINNNDSLIKNNIKHFSINSNSGNKLLLPMGLIDSISFKNKDVNDVDPGIKDFVIYNNKVDPHISKTIFEDSSVLDIYGNKDDNGYPTSISTIEYQDKDSLFSTLSFKENKLIGIYVAKEGGITLEYENEEINVTVQGYSTNTSFVYSIPYENYGLNYSHLSSPRNNNMTDTTLNSCVVMVTKLGESFDATPGIVVYNEKGYYRSLITDYVRLSKGQYLFTYPNSVYPCKENIQDFFEGLDNAISRARTAMDVFFQECSLSDFVLLAGSIGALYGEIPYIPLVLIYGVGNSVNTLLPTISTSSYLGNHFPAWYYQENSFTDALFSAVAKYNGKIYEGEQKHVTTEDTDIILTVDIPSKASMEIKCAPTIPYTNTTYRVDVSYSDIPLNSECTISVSGTDGYEYHMNNLLIGGQDTIEVLVRAPIYKDYKHKIKATIRLSDGGTISKEHIVCFRGEEQHEYVDLGLSVKWATCNVGASRPEDYGSYYRWGETSSYTVNYYKHYKTEVVKHQGGVWEFSGYTKYVPSGSSWCGFKGYSDDKYYLDPIDDVAHVRWGGGWRIPSFEEFVELFKYCSWEWITLNGVNGYKGTSLKRGFEDRYIFLPAAGMKEYGRDQAGEYGGYWCNELFSCWEAMGIFFMEDLICIDGGPGGYHMRENGRSIRPVHP